VLKSLDIAGVRAQFAKLREVAELYPLCAVQVIAERYPLCAVQVIAELYPLCAVQVNLDSLTKLYRYNSKNFTI
jgi:hypothetical protein